jgi:hypothetical protein
MISIKLNSVLGNHGLTTAADGRQLGKRSPTLVEYDEVHLSPHPKLSHPSHVKRILGQFVSGQFVPRTIGTRTIFTYGTIRIPEQLVPQLNLFQQRSRGPTRPGRACAESLF